MLGSGREVHWFNTPLYFTKSTVFCSSRFWLPHIFFLDLYCLKQFSLTKIKGIHSSHFLVSRRLKKST